MPAPETITILEILTLLKNHLGVNVPRSSVYYYQHHHNFPKSIGLGRPARWRLDKVMKWIKARAKK